MTEHAPHALPVLAILTNTVAPYRLPIYRNLAARFRVHVFTTSEASIRTTWNGIDRDVPNVTIERTRGIGVSYVRRVEGIALIGGSSKSRSGTCGTCSGFDRTP